METKTYKLSHQPHPDAVTSVVIKLPHFADHSAKEAETSRLQRNLTGFGDVAIRAEGVSFKGFIGYAETCRVAQPHHAADQTRILEGSFTQVSIDAENNKTWTISLSPLDPANRDQIRVCQRAALTFNTFLRACYGSRFLAHYPEAISTNVLVP